MAVEMDGMGDGDGSARAAGLLDDPIRPLEAELVLLMARLADGNLTSWLLGISMRLYVDG